MTPLTILSFLIWCWLLTLHGRFWRAGPVLPVATVPPTAAPSVASWCRRATRRRSSRRRSGRCWRSTIPAPFRVTLVDDGSADGTGEISSVRSATSG